MCFGWIRSLDADGVQRVRHEVGIGSGRIGSGGTAIEMMMMMMMMMDETAIRTTSFFFIFAMHTLQVVPIQNLQT